MIVNALYDWVTRQHQHPTTVGQLLLRPLAWGYRFGTWVNQQCRSCLVTPTTPPVPVISVGNLSTGGTGKTPIVIALAQWLVDNNTRVVVLSRGYKATKPLDYGQPTGPHHSDEAWLIQQTVPDATVIVGKDRAHNALRACEDYSPDVILLDDGFQHQALARQLNIVLWDASQTNQQLLPAGPLREPVSSLARADWVWVTKGSDDQRQQAIQHLQNIAQQSQWSLTVADCPFTMGEPELTPGQAVSEISTINWQTTPVTAVCGIARPQQFFNQLRREGFQLSQSIALPDHGIPTAEDLTTWQRSGRPIVTTTKDWVKIQPLLAKQSIPISPALWWVIPVTPQWPQSLFANWCDRHL